MRVAGYQVLKFLENRRGFCRGLAFDAFSHHRCGGGGNRATGPLKADVLNHAVFHLEKELHLVAAQRVEALGMSVGDRERAEIPRLLLVIQDDLLVQIAQIRHQPNTSLTLCKLLTRASISSL